MDAVPAGPAMVGVSADAGGDALSEPLSEGLPGGLPNRVAARPAAMVAAAGRLDVLADRIRAAQQAHSPAVHAVPAGAEEVSLTVSRTQCRVADSFDVAARTGAAELRRAAEALRMQAAAYSSTDGAGAALVAPVF